MTLPTISEGKGVGSGTFPDLFVDSLATAVATAPTTDNFHSWMGMDPMLLETQGCTVGTRDTVSPDNGLNALSPLQVLKSATGPAREAHVECILEADQSINIAVAGLETETEDMRDEPVDSHLFLNSILPPVPNSTLPALQSLHFYHQIQQKVVRATTTLLNSTCIGVPVLTAPTSGYGVFLCIPKEGVKMQHYNAWTSYTSNFNIKRNTTIDDKVYS
jgi:hypothetical protein